MQATIALPVQKRFTSHVLKFSGHKENVFWDLSDKYPFWGPLSSYKCCLQTIYASYREPTAFVRKERNGFKPNLYTKEF